MNKHLKEEILKISYKKVINDKTFFQIAGWTSYDASLLSQLIDEINGSQFSKIVISEEYYYSIFGDCPFKFLKAFCFCQKNKFGNREIVIDNEFIENSREDFGINDNDPYIIIVPQEGEVCGIIIL